MFLCILCGRCLHCIHLCPCFVVVVDFGDEPAPGCSVGIIMINSSSSSSSEDYSGRCRKGSVVTALPCRLQYNSGCTRILAAHHQPSCANNLQGCGETSSRLSVSVTFGSVGHLPLLPSKQWQIHFSWLCARSVSQSVVCLAVHSCKECYRKIMSHLPFVTL